LSADKEGGQKGTTLKAILDNNADINNMDSNGWTALHHAAYNGDMKSVETLLNSKA
jgi:ankyrin repeat protein